MNAYKIRLYNFFFFFLHVGQSISIYFFSMNAQVNIFHPVECVIIFLSLWILNHTYLTEDVSIFFWSYILVYIYLSEWTRIYFISQNAQEICLLYCSYILFIYQNTQKYFHLSERTIISFICQKAEVYFLLLEYSSNFRSFRIHKYIFHEL